MFADLFYWAFDQVDNAAGLLAEGLAWILSSDDAFYELFARLFFLQLFLAGLLSLALSV